MLIFLVSCVPISSQWSPTKPSSCIDQISFHIAALWTDVITDGKLFLSRDRVESIQSNDIIVRSHSSTPYIQSAEITNATSTKACRYRDFRAWCIGHNYRDHPFTLRRSVRYFPYVCIDEPKPLVRALNPLAENYKASNQWSIIESNTGVLSACLPTLRPLYSGYRINSLMPKLTSFFRGSRSTTLSKDNMRLDFIEQGNRPAGDPLPIYDELDSPIRSAEILHYHESDQPWRSSQECI